MIPMNFYIPQPPAPQPKQQAQGGGIMGQILGMGGGQPGAAGGQGGFDPVSIMKLIAGLGF